MNRLAKLMCVVAAFWGIPVMNTQAADSAAWLGAMSGSRPLLLRKENPSRGFDSNAVHGDWSSQDADRIVAKHTGMVLSGSFSWENSYSAADGERVDTCSFTADDGSVNRFSVLSYRSALSPYAWTSDSGKAGENFDPVEFVRSRFNAEGTSSISWMGRLVSAADVEIRELGEVIAVPWDKYYFFLVDDLPGANWSHPCRYVFLSEDGSSFAVLYKQHPPRLFSAADGASIYLKAAETQDESIEDAAKQLNAVTSKVYSYANSLREENSLSYSTGNKSKSHFVLICGGAAPQSNGIRFWCDTAMLYSTLTLKYGVSKDNIHVYMSDGVSTNADANLASTSSGVTPVLVSSPHDLDGDGYSDIDGAATKSDVRSCFNSLASSLSSSDQLFVFITSHGSPEGTAGPNNYGCLAWLYAADGGNYGSDGERAYFWDEDLAEWTSGMACPVAFAIETCYSGGFIDDITQTPKRVIATACNHCESSWGLGGGGAWHNGLTGSTGAYNRWAAPFSAALRGCKPAPYASYGYPWADGAAVDADSNGDGLVSFNEARLYAYNNDAKRCTLSTHTSTCGKDNNVEHPQYAESTTGLGDNFFMLKQTSSNFENLEINIVSGLTSGSCSVKNDGSTWKILESFPSWVKGVSFYCSANGNLMSLTSNGTTIGFSGIATMTVSCTTNDTGATRSWDMTISNRTTKAIQYLVHVRQEPYSSVSVPVATQISIPSTYGYYGNTSYIQMTWTNVANATSYNVYRSESSSSSGRSKIATNVTSPYKDYATTSSLVPGKKYWYWVEAVNSAGSSFSNSDWGNILVYASLSKTTLGFTAAGGTSNITVTANTSWTATKSDSWLSLSTSGTSGNGSIAVTATANTNTTSRTGRIVVTAGAGTSYPKAVTNVVTQAAGVSLVTALDNTTLSFTTSESSSWFGQTSITHDGVDAAQSGALGNSQTNWLQTTVSGPGTISFWWYASSEQNWDYLEFLIDGGVVDSMSGTNNVWTSKSFTISASGTHTLQWRYRKDGSQYRGLDAGFVDQVTWTPSTSPTPTTYTVTYQLNGGTHGATHPSSATYDTAFYVSAPTKSGYTFTGWTVTSGLNTSTAKWGTTSSPSTSLTSATTKCVNGATGDVWFMNLTPTANGSVTLTANWSTSDSEPIWTIDSSGKLTAVDLNGCTDIAIPEGVKSIAAQVFSGLGVTSVRFPSTLKTVGSYAFKNCSCMTNVTFSTGLTSLGQCSFAGCSSLAGVFELPEGLTKIGRAFVFGSCKVTDIVLPTTLTTMDEQEFIGCSNVVRVWFKGDAPSVPDGSSRSDQYKYETSPYYGASASLVSYVPYGSTGWLDSSSALPSLWPTKTWDNYAARPIQNYSGEPPQGTSGVVPATSPTTPTTYTVTYQSGSYASGSTYTATKTNDIALVLRGSTYTRTGYTQTGWSTSSAGTSKSYNLSASYTANSAITLYPYWTPNTYSVAYALNGGTHGATHPSSATYDTAFYVSAPTKSGYTFTGWTVTSGLNTSTAKWGTSSNPSTTISSSSTKCVNGATGNVYFKNLTTTANGSVTLTANWTASSDFTYNIVSGSAVITKYTGSSSTVVIPSTIDGYTVTELADYAFHQSTITSITLPDSLTTMGWFSLANCRNLTTIHLPANVAQFTSRQYAPFGGNTSQATFTVAAENTHFTAVDGVLFTKDMKELISFPAGKNVERYDIPSSVTNIWGCAFDSCKYLVAVTIPEGVSSLMYCAFESSSKLTSVSLPESLRTIDFYVFQNCSSLKSLTIPAGVTTIGYNALNTSSLTNLVLLGRSGGGSYASARWGASIANANIWVMPDDYDYWTAKLGEGLSVIAGDVTVDVGGGKSVTVPGTWLAEKTTRAVTAVAANGRKVWECYVVGLDPEIATSDFKLTSFPMKADGTPDLEHIVFEPPQARWNVPATWKVKGATTLDGPWGVVPAGGNPAYRFFKVEVVLP